MFRAIDLSSADGRFSPRRALRRRFSLSLSMPLSVPMPPSIPLRWGLGPATPAGLLAGLVAGLLAGTLPAQEPGNYERVRRLVREYEAIQPPPPPVEAVELGTLDAQSGTWTWGRSIERKEVEEPNPALAPVFEALRLPPLHVPMSPGLRLPAVFTAGQPVAMPRFRPATGGDARTGAGARTGPGRGTGNDRNIATTARTQEYTGPSAGKWKYFTSVRAGKVVLVVRVVNRSADAQLSVSCEGETVAAAADQVELLVPPRVMVNFTIQCGNRRFEDRVWFERPPILGFFQLEALPIAVIYEPPGSGSSQSYAVTEELGTTLRAFGSTSGADEVPVPTNFSRVADFMGMVAGAGKVVEQVYPQVGAAMKGAKEGFDKLLGSQERSSKVEHTVTEEHALAIRLSKTATVTTRAGLGPGRGDMIWYLYRPIFAWLCAQDEDSGRMYLTVALLTFQRCSAHSAEALRTGAVPEPDAEMRRLLLAHDVLAPEHAAQPGVLLRRVRPSAGDRIGTTGLRRLVPAELPEQEVPAGGEMRLVIERQRTEEDVSIETTTETVTTTESRGVLGYLAKGLPQEGTRTMTVTMGSSVTQSSSKTLRVEVTLAGRLDEAQRMRCWYDRRSGTFAYEVLAYGEATSSLVNPPATLLRTAPIPANGAGTGIGSGVSAAERVDAGPAFTARAIEGLGRRMGRLSLQFPPAAPADSTKVELFEAVEGEAARSVATEYGSCRIDLLPGEYSVNVSGRAVPAVRIAAGHETVLHVGTLRVHAGENTKAEILAAAEPAERLERAGRPERPERPEGPGRVGLVEPVLYTGYGTFEVGLPVGGYRVRIRGRSEGVTVTAGQVTEF